MYVLILLTKYNKYNNVTHDQMLNPMLAWEILKSKIYFDIVDCNGHCLTEDAYIIIILRNERNA